MNEVQVSQEGGSSPQRQRTALLSVYNKTGIVNFAQGLVELGWKLVSSTGTMRELRGAGLEVTDVADIVGPAILGHKVATLSREISAAILASLEDPEEVAELARIKVEPIDLVCVDMYPLQDSIAKAGATLARVLKDTDIGGPTLLRAAAKGGRLVVCTGEDRDLVLSWLRNSNWNTYAAFQNALAAKAEEVVGAYCLASAAYRRGQQLRLMCEAKDAAAA